MKKCSECQGHLFSAGKWHTSVMICNSFFWVDLSTVGYKRYPAYLTDHLLKVSVCLLYRDWIGKCFLLALIRSTFRYHVELFILRIKVMNWNSSFWTTFSIVAWYLDDDLCIQREDYYVFFWWVQIVLKDVPKLRNLKIGFYSQKIPQWQCITLHCLILDFRVPFLSIDFILECLCYSN